jgi:acetyltransferase-like isoleucine patch superfamily enzyme
MRFWKRKAYALDCKTVRRKIYFVNFIFQRILGINKNVPWSVHYTSLIIRPENIKIGKNVAISFAVSGGWYIQATNGIEIGDDVLIAPGVKIVSANHDEVTFKATREPPVVIGNHCWLGTNSVILPGVTLGNHVIVGAGSVVTKSFPGGVILGGVPAKIIRKIKNSEDIKNNFEFAQNDKE